MSRPIPTDKGTVLGRWTLLESAPNKTVRVWAECGCGREYERSVIHMEHNPQCHSCAATMRNTTHGYRQRPEYRRWCSMMERCYNPNYQGYKHYGGRGVTVCERWRHSFENFLADMGELPFPGAQLDKDILSPHQRGMIYSPEYCQWVTKKQNISYAWNEQLKTNPLEYTYYTNIL